MNIEVIIIALGIFLLIDLVVLLVLMGRNFHSSSRKDTKEISEAHEKSVELIHDSMRQAQSILTDAELEGLKLTAQEKLQSKELLTAYEHKLNTLLKQITQELNKHGKAAGLELQDKTKELENLAAKSIIETGKELDRRAEEHFKKADALMDRFARTLQNRTDQEVEKKLSMMKAGLEEYRRQQMQAIDTQIVDIVNIVIEKIAQRALSVDEHTDLIFESLEEAKKEGLFK